jgi:hypothetical protein
MPTTEDKVSLCSGGGCCPDATFEDDGSLTLTEDGVTLRLIPDAAKLLAEHLRIRGYLLPR